MNDELMLFSEAHLLQQLEYAPYNSGFYTLRFYSREGHPSASATDTTAVFYFYPSGGTLRDEKCNIIFYNAKFDTYRGFKHPHSGA